MNCRRYVKEGYCLEVCVTGVLAKISPKLLPEFGERKTKKKDNENKEGENLKGKEEKEKEKKRKK